MTVAEATQLLKSTGGDQIKIEILPVRLVEQKSSKENLYPNNPGMWIPIINAVVKSNSKSNLIVKSRCLILTNVNSYHMYVRLSFATQLQELCVCCPLT